MLSSSAAGGGAVDMPGSSSPGGSSDSGSSVGPGVYADGSSSDTGSTVKVKPLPPELAAFLEWCLPHLGLAFRGKCCTHVLKYPTYLLTY